MSLKAEEIVLMLGPEFYHENQNTIIEKDVFIRKGQFRNDNILSENVYKVNFQKKTDNINSKSYDATITFLKSTGKPYRVSFGNWMVLLFDTKSHYELFKLGVRIKCGQEGLQSIPESEAYFK